MIDEEATFEQFGYYSYDWVPKSGKEIVVVCDDCGKARVVQKRNYRALCKSCLQKGESAPNWKGGGVKCICENCGTKFPASPSRIKKGGGRFCSLKCLGRWNSRHHRGENNPAWKNGASFEPYCSKFNFTFKEYIREKFSRTCFLCPTTEEENGRRLSVHHVNYNKSCGCDDDKTCQFVPLCISCNTKVNSNREMWEKKIKNMMHKKLNGWYI